MTCSISHHVPYASASRTTAKSRSSHPPLISPNHTLPRSLRLLSIRRERGEFLRAGDARARYPCGVERAVAVRIRRAGTEARRERDRPCSSWRAAAVSTLSLRCERRGCLRRKRTTEAITPTLKPTPLGDARDVVSGVIGL